LADLGLDWQDAPPPPARPKPAPDPGVEDARLFALDRYGTTRATLTTEGNVCRVEVTAVDVTDQLARLTRIFDKTQFQEGASYTVRFRAKADAPRPIVLDTQVSPPYAYVRLGEKTVDLTENWQYYEYEFRAKNLYEFRAKNLEAWNEIQFIEIHFIVGQQTGTVWIEDFTLTPAEK
jgi:hypothetical protein